MEAITKHLQQIGCLDVVIEGAGLPTQMWISLRESTRRTGARPIIGRGSCRNEIPHAEIIEALCPRHGTRTFKLGGDIVN
jgi:hypothetical protein